jgi:hypothetical protein
LYTEELMLYSPYLSSALVQSYIALLSPANRESQVRVLMQRIIETRSESAPDKLFALTMASGITEPFLTVASRSRVRFFMIHEVFMKFNHAFNEDQFLIYFKSLSEGLLSPEPHQSPLTLLDAASQLFIALGSGGRQWFRKVTALLEDHPVLRHHKGYWENLASLAAKPPRLVTLRA